MLVAQISRLSQWTGEYFLQERIIEVQGALYPNIFLHPVYLRGVPGKMASGVVELKLIEIRWVEGVSWNIHMDFTIKKDKIVLVVPSFSSSVPAPTPFFLEQP